VCREGRRECDTGKEKLDRVKERGNGEEEMVGQSCYEKMAC